MNVLPCRVEGATALVDDAADRARSHLSSLPRGQRIELGIRPEFVQLQPNGFRSAGRGAAHRRSRPGPHRAGRDGGARIRSRASRTACAIRAATAASLAFDPAHVHVYADGHLVTASRRRPSP